MPYRISRSFVVESAHMLTKHPGRCRFPHGHSREITVVLRAEGLDSNEMVCDFKALKLALVRVCDRYDHALVVGSHEPLIDRLGSASERLIVYEGQDPTTEVMAKHIYEEVRALFSRAGGLRDKDGAEYRWPDGLHVERVRVTETASTWAEYGE